MHTAPVAASNRSSKRVRLFAVLLASVLGIVIVFASSCGDGAPQRTRRPQRDSLIRGPILDAAQRGEDPHAADNSCLTCHHGIEFIRCSDTGMFHAILKVARRSGTNNRCVVCHGGNPEIRAPDGLGAASVEYAELAKSAHSGSTEFLA